MPAQPDLNLIIIIIDTKFTANFISHRTANNNLDFFENIYKDLKKSITVLYTVREKNNRNDIFVHRVTNIYRKFTKI
jgi:hypothetical protein